jgi:type I restriction enzyme S subunit
MMKCILKDLIEYSKDGEWGKDQSFEESEEMLCVRGTDFESARFGSTEKVPRRFIAQRHADRKRLQPWDVLIEAAGGTKDQPTGRTVLLKPSVFRRASLPLTCASFSRLIRFRTDLCDPTFMFWYLQSLYHSDIMRAYHTQHTGVARFQWTTFAENEPLQIPDLPTQRKIAGILSAYDDLIENNLRRIKILEEMAQSLYREWFIHFRFPGHESAKFVDSSLGQIPRGWEVKKLEQILELKYGKALKKEDRREGQYPVFGSSGIVGTHDMSLTKGPGIVVGRKGNVGSVFWSDADFFVIDTAYFVESCLPLRFLFYLLPTLNFINSDAAVPGLSRQQAYTLETMVPPADLLTKFCSLADSFEKQASMHRLQNQNLRRTRDLLLPKLLDGNSES